jgi:BirA family biotin operon repressor/biotin-[acetyl-CoA-carboxylase] ligase
MTAPASQPRIVRYGVVASTQPIAFELAQGGAEDGTVVVADAQTIGRGRRGRIWHAEAGTSVLASFILRPRLAAPLLPTLSFAAALAVADTVTKLAEAAPRVKWPNDVLIDGRKIAGILLESRLTGDGTVVVIGIGLNLTQERFAEEVRETATSLLLATGRRVERDAALAVLREDLQAWRGRLERDGFGPIRERWLALSDTIGRRVAIDGVTGTAVDLALDGALLVDDGRGVRRVVAGEVLHAAGR